MKEQGILFSTPMVQRLLNPHPITGVLKTETRRLYSPKRPNRFEVGTRLWVRETFAKIPQENGIGVLRKADNPKPSFFWRGDFYDIKWTPSIHMPKRFARIWREIVTLRIEPLLDISDEGAVHEGFVNREDFLETFYKLNPKENGNPLVWVIGMKEVSK